MKTELEGGDDEQFVARYTQLIQQMDKLHLVQRLSLDDEPVTFAPSWRRTKRVSAPFRIAWATHSRRRLPSRAASRSSNSRASPTRNRQLCSQRRPRASSPRTNTALVRRQDNPTSAPASANRHRGEALYTRHHHQDIARARELRSAQIGTAPSVKRAPCQGTVPGEMHQCSYA